MSEQETRTVRNIDEEWLELILEAKALGIPYQEIINFFRKSNSD